MAAGEGTAARRARFQETEQQRDEDEHPGMLKPQSSLSSTDEQEPFMGMKMRRRSSMYRPYKGDYLDVASNDRIKKLLSKQGLHLSPSLSLCKPPVPVSQGFIIFRGATMSD